MLPPAAPQPARPHRLSRWAVQAAIAPPQAARHGQALPSGPRFTHDRRAGAEGLPKRSFVLAVLAAIVVGVAPPGAVHGPASLYAAEERETGRLETMVLEEPAAAGLGARSLLADIEAQQATRSGFAATATRQESSMRGLADDADADAARNRTRAADAARAAAAPGLTEAERDSRLRDAAFWQRQADDDARRAGERRRDADRLAQDRERLRDTVDVLAGLADRLRRVIERADRPEAAPADTATATAPAADDAPAGAADPDEPAYTLTLEGLIGIWQPVDGGERAHAIVQADPDGDPLAIELHTPDRVWRGRFEPPSAGSPGRARAPRVGQPSTPRADEINPATPDWAGQQVAGRLVWRLDVDESGAPYDPRLSVKFHRGRVRWSEEELTAELAGDGPPEIFELEPETVLDEEEQGQLSVGLQIPAFPDHDAFDDPAEALLKGQRFHVLVRVPAFAAQEIGPSLTVNVRGVDSGAAATIALEAGAAVGDRPVVYANREPVTLGDCHAMLNPPANPPFLSMNWLLNVSGDCIDFAFADGEPVVFEVQGAAQEVRMYRSWVQRALVRSRQGLERLTAVMEAVLDSPDAGPPQRQAARERLQMLANLGTILDNGELTDVHKYAVAELYLGENSGPSRFLGGIGVDCVPPPGSALGLVHHAPATLDAWERGAARCGRRPQTDPDYDTPQLRRFIEGLTGRPVAIRAPDRAEAGVVWTSQAERAFVRQTLAGTSRDLLSEGLRTGVEGFAFGMYDGIVQTSGLGQAHIVFTGSDHFGQRVSRMERVLSGVLLTSGAILTLRVVYGSTFKRAGRTAQTGRVFAKDRTLVQRGAGRVSSLAARADPPDLPVSVRPRQRPTLRLSLEGEPATNGRCDCARTGRPQPSPAVSRRAPAPSMAASPAPAPVWSAVDGPTGDAARAWVRGAGNYGADAVLLVENADGSLPRMTWARSTCNAMASAYIVLKKTGQRIAEAVAQQEVTRIIGDQAQPSAPNARQLTRPLQDPLTGKWFNLRRFRTAGDQFAGWGFGSGFDQFSIRDFLRRYGLRVAENNVDVAPNARVGLRHYLAAVREGYMVKTVVKFTSPGTTQHAAHAVVVQDVIVNPVTRRISWVELFDPLVGIVRVRAKHFDAMLYREAGYGIFTAVR